MDQNLDNILVGVTTKKNTMNNMSVYTQSLLIEQEGVNKQPNN